MDEFNRQRTWDGTVLLVADPSTGDVPATEFDRRIDRPLEGTVKMIYEGLKASCDNVVQFSDLTAFTTALEQYKDCLVFPYWFGESSRSRHGLVPAICEANDVMFVGADAYAKVVCNDKELTKAICKQSRLKTPNSAVLTSVQDIQYANYLSLPVVVKPNYEGTSLGITDRNLCNSWEAVSAVAAELFENLGQPVILEEFIVGREFSACLLGNQHDQIAMEIGGWKINGDSNFLNNRLNTFDLKMPSGYRFAFEDLKTSFQEETVEAFIDCFHRLGKTELLRIDGRITKDNEIIILELTPDIYLGADGEFCSAYGYDEKTFNNFISRIVSNSIKGYKASMPMR
ncbi:D-alanine-D-alanine ligase [Herbaspirillum sp. Sphag1AN]|uniref:hypothetical protein n=1 Tax=unclassified Herbaspirillum TaxID=2624150 RepID=UPI00161AB0E4|nr:MULTISPECIES: hypothetical protein [unclassified Herbaspirillum]MBB3211648.1 D-alanine-D-alanine ligase [Herbaspirillum sp. Sphag1AN]MBB3245084.1 D-alanine-D-alanine ligase [Herbaspirillum sp. Sphag64]